MNLKAYLRGIGAGMIVSALVIGVGRATAPKPSEPIDKSTLKTSVSSVTASISVSDDKEENKKPGSEASTETSAGTESAGSETSDKTGAGGEEPKGTETPSSTVNSETSKTEEPEDPDAESRTEDTKTSTSEGTESSAEGNDETGEEDENGEYVTITIVKGDSSKTASRKVFVAGLVESAVEFDAYLCENGYDKSISVGTFKIKMGSTFEEIARTISRRKKTDQ
ncbi:MAG: hypothetical protein K6E32_02760 [Lachnospiraceae bacterium]|nr:hypothetical protein [Lachnospiraceae bacterium]